MKISVTIITLNEEENLSRCLQSVQGLADEIIVVDSGSKDQTCQIASSWGAQVVKRGWTNYSDQKNFAACSANNDWILSLDADECLSSDLRQELLAVKNMSSSVVAYEFPRKACYLGRWISHGGWYPDYKVRLYKRNQGRWVGDFVHERLSCDGTVNRLNGNLLHYTCSSISEHAHGVSVYTTLAAQDLNQRGSKRSIIQIILGPFISFWSTYILKCGFLDGFHGFLIAVFSAYYTFLKYSKLWDICRKQHKNNSSFQ